MIRELSASVRNELLFLAAVFGLLTAVSCGGHAESGQSQQVRAAPAQTSPAQAAPTQAAPAEKRDVFYAIGAGEYIPPDAQNPWRNPYNDVRLYEVDSATLHVVQSLSVERETPGYGPGKVWMSSGMLTGNRDAILLTEGELGDFRLMRVSAPGLAIEGHAKMGDLTIRGTWCLDHIFVHPVTSLAYFSCEIGKHGDGFVILDPVKHAVVADFPDGPPALPGWPSRLFLFRPQFVYASESRRLYLIGDDVVVLDPQNHPIDYILARDVAAAAGLDLRARHMIEKMAVLPEGKLAVLVTDSRTPTLVLYDAVGRKVLGHWTETQEYTEMETYIDSRTGMPFEKPVQKIARLHDGPVLSRDGSRLFAMSEGDVILWDSSTLEELDRFDAPEPGGTDLSFYPAPDGRGMWFVSQSGKVYRLDDHTGHLIEEVKLPFRLISLIREP